MQRSMLWALGIVLLMLPVSEMTNALQDNNLAGYEKVLDLILAGANETDFPECYGYGDNVFIARAETTFDGNASILITAIDVSTTTFINISAGWVAESNITVETFAPSIASYNNSIYVAWVEKEGIVLAEGVNGTVVKIVRLEGIDTYYHAPSLAAFGKKVMLSFLHGDNAGNSTLAVAEFGENGSYILNEIDRFLFNAPRKTACGYDIHGNAHVFLANTSSIEHYYFNATSWQHEKIAVGGTPGSEVNVKLLNNQCYLGYKEVSGGNENTLLVKGEIAQNGSIQVMETLILSTYPKEPQDNIYCAERVYITQSGSRTLYVTWSERNPEEKIIKSARIVENEIAEIETLEGGKICGCFAESNRLHIITIDGEYLHYKIYRILREGINLAILDATPTSVTLGWNRCFDEDFVCYEIHYSTAANFTPSLATLYTEIYESTLTTSNVENLELGKNYFFLLLVKFTTGETVLSNTVSYTTPAPVEVVNASVSEVDKDRFTLTWEKKECKGYQVHFALNPEFNAEEVIDLDNTTTTYTFDTLNASTTYFVFVRSLGFYGEYADSEILPVLTKPELLSTIANVDEITIHWARPSEFFFEKLEVYASKNMSTVFDSSSLYTTVYEPQVTSLQIRLEEIGTEFYFGIAVYNTYWQSARSNILSNTTYLPTIPQVSIEKYEILNATAVKIYFEVPEYSYFSHLEIHLSTESNFTPSERTLLNSIYTQGERSYTIYGLTPEVQYHVKIVLIDVFGQKSSSQEMKVRITTSIECPQPEPEIPFYLYGLLLIIFFVSSIIAGLYTSVSTGKKLGKNKERKNK